MKRKYRLDNLGQTFRTITARGYLPWDREVSGRLHAAALQQLNARNLFTDELLKHPDTPVQKSAAKNETGLYGLWLEWRKAVPYLAETKQAIWRPAATLAKTAVGAWTATNTKHADLIAKSEDARRRLLDIREKVHKAEMHARTEGLTGEEQESFTRHEATLKKAEGELYAARENASSRLESTGQKATAKLVNADPAVKHAKKAATTAAEPVTQLRKQAESRGLTADERDQLATNRKALRQAGTALEKAQRKARNAEKRAIRPETLFDSRKDRDRRRRNRLVYHEDVTVSNDRRSLTLPGVGTVQLSKPVRADLDVRAAVLIERTPPAKGNCRRLPATERTWRVLIQGRVDAPLKTIPDDPKDIRSAGGDHGVEHALTVSNSDGSSTHYHYAPLSKNDIKRWTRLNARQGRCTCGSREWKRLQRLMRGITGRHARRKAQTRLEWANEIAKSNHHVGIEHLRNVNMRASAKGQNEAAGKNVAAKRGLNRALAETSPGYQTNAVKAASIRHGATYRLVPPPWTSTTCNQCGYNDNVNRESQAVFRCRKCGSKANADVNAGHIVRLLGLAYNRVGVDRSWMAEAIRTADISASKAKDGKAPFRANSTWIQPPPPRTPKAQSAAG